MSFRQEKVRAMSRRRESIVGALLESERQFRRDLASVESDRDRMVARRREAIKAAHASGLSVREIGRQLQLHPSRISQILNDRQH